MNQNPFGFLVHYAPYDRHEPLCGDSTPLLVTMVAESVTCPACRDLSGARQRPHSSPDSSAPPPSF